MLTFIARMKVKPDKEQEFVRLSERLTERVLATEPNTLIYQFFRQRDKALEFAVIEQFTDEAAEEFHRNTPHFNELAPPLIACIDGTYHREYLDPMQT